LPLAILLGAAVQVADAPQALGAIAFVKNVGVDAIGNNSTSISVTVPAGGVAFGHTVLVSFAMDPAAGAVSCADTKGNSYSAVVDFANGSGTSGVRTVVFAARIVAATGSYLADGTTVFARWAATIATFGAASCGNGVVEAAEACDDGNLANGDCCSSACTIEAAGTVCRAAAGACDVQETCTGSSATCPADAKSTAVCRASAGICDVVESCDGIGDTCPADGFVAAGVTCRGAAGVCDVAEKCTGSSASCPADAK